MKNTGYTAEALERIHSLRTWLPAQAVPRTLLNSLEEFVLEQNSVPKETVSIQVDLARRLLRDAFSSGEGWSQKEFDELSALDKALAAIPHTLPWHGTDGRTTCSNL